VKIICGMITSRREILAEAQGELAKVFGPVDIVSDIMDFDFTHYYDQEMGSPLLRQFVSFAKLAAPESLVEAKHATNALEQAFAAARAHRGCGEDAANHGTQRAASDPSPCQGEVPPSCGGEGALALPFPGERAVKDPHPALSLREQGSSAQLPLPRPINLDPGFVDSPKLVLASMKNYAHRIHLGRGVYAEVTLLHRRGLWAPLEWTFPDYASGRYWPFLDQARKRLREQLGSENPQ
jgi:hypothetical protein